MRVIRKRFRVLLLATIVAAVAVPVGFALSLDPASPVYHATSVAPTAIVMPTFVSDSDAVGGWFSSVSDVSDAVKLLLVGTTLFGLAAVVRRAS